MFVIEVIPLRRGVAIESLSYYSKTQYRPGTIVTIPIRGAQCRGIVLDGQPVSATKTTLRSATFTLRKLPAQKDPTTLPSALIQVADTLQAYYPATAGAILYSLLSSDITDGSCQFIHTAHTVHREDSTPQIIQAISADRCTMYQSHIRSVLGRGGSVLCVVPTAADVQVLAERLGTGISDRLARLSPHDSKKQRQRNWYTIQSATTPLLIITTPGYAIVDRDDVMSIIVEQAGSGHYRARTRPYLDFRDVCETLAKARGCSIIFGDCVIRTEHEHRRRQDEIQSYDETPKRLIFPSRLQLMPHPERKDGDTSFALFTEETVDRLHTALNQRKNVFLYAARRGIAPLIMCYDCGEIVRCEESGNPYSLLRTYTPDNEEERWFVDSTSGIRVRAADTCAYCGSWRLRERGIGIQHIEQALPDLFPQTPILTFDSTTATTAKKARELRDHAAEMKGGIILGTALALPYLPPSIAISCVTSLEAAQSIPSWRADEMFFRLLLELREKSTQDVLVQARGTVGEVLTHAKRGAVEQFYDEEISLRELLHYPPFATLILLTWTGTKASVATIEAQIKATLTSFPPHIYNHPLSEQHKTKRYALLRIPHTDWPHAETMEALQELPPSVKVEINPDRIV